MGKLRLIGDVHGKIPQYLNLIKDCDKSIQLGDMGFDYSLLTNIDESNHKVLLGNHDNYNCIPPHSLGDYGVVEYGNIQIFFIRGGNSIDKKYRTLGVDWFAEEELSYTQSTECLNLYSQVKDSINVIISHECPLSVIKYVGAFSNIQPSSTAYLLQSILDEKPPKMWFFGHHHKDWSKDVDGTIFCCLNELSYLDLDYDNFS